jgi:hypothetical protein
MSLGVSVDTKHLKEMCGDAQGWTKGKILICCAPHVRGLSRTDVDFPSAYAANYDFVVSVGATNGDLDPISDAISPALFLDNYDAVTIFAPGVLVYSTLPTQARGTTGEAAETGYGERSGTSFACPMVTGVASLMWSKNAALTAAQVIACLETTADEITYDRNIRDADGHIILTVKTSHRRLNASAAVASALWHVEPENSHLVFTDVVAGSSEAQQVVFDITCGHRLNFNITPGPSGALPGTLTVAPASGAYDPATGGTFALSTVTYAPAAAGETATGDFTITCAETAQVWTIYVTANAAPAETAAAVLIADRSGSMNLPSGIDMLTRMDVLRSAAGILVDTMRVNDALGIVGFSTDVDIPWPLADITEATNRDTIKAAVNAIAPGGATSIGGGVESGATVLSPATQTHRGLMVLTDGQENTPPMIADVLGSVSVPVYAIGMGTAQALQPAALDALTVSTGGYLLLTDTLDDTARYRVAKYVLQMLAGITDTSMVLDPAGMLRARQEISIPFDLCEEDRECDVVLMTTVPAWVRLTIVGPDGEDVKVRREVVNGAGAELLSRRFPLPLGDVHAGTWRAILSIVSGEAEVALAELAAARDAAPALPYHLVVMSKSNIMMRCRAQATSIRPGATVTLRSVVTRRGLPFDKHVSVEATVSTHDQDTKVTLARTAPGVFEGTFTATQSGVYACLVRATGLIENGQRFTREQTVTAHTWSFDAPPGSDERDRAREKNPPS